MLDSDKLAETEKIFWQTIVNLADELIKHLAFANEAIDQVEKRREEFVLLLDLSHLLLVESNLLHRDAALVHLIQICDTGNVVTFRILLRALAGLVRDETALEDISNDTVESAAVPAL